MVPFSVQLKGLRARLRARLARPKRIERVNIDVRLLAGGAMRAIRGEGGGGH